MVHYHLLGGLQGLYIPNMNEVYISHKDAQQALEDIVEKEIDQMVAGGVEEEEAESNVWWNRELDYVSIKQGGNEMYEITECTEDCKLEG